MLNWAGGDHFLFPPPPPLGVSSCTSPSSGRYARRRSPLPPLRFPLSVPFGHGVFAHPLTYRESTASSPFLFFPLPLHRAVWPRWHTGFRGIQMTATLILNLQMGNSLILGFRVDYYRDCQPRLVTNLDWAKSTVFFVLEFLLFFLRGLLRIGNPFLSAALFSARAFF